jgi:hypothetical protein
MSQPEYLSQSEWQKLKDTLAEAGLTDVYGAVVAMNREVELLRDMVKRSTDEKVRLIEVFAEQMGKLAKGES